MSITSAIFIQVEIYVFSMLHNQTVVDIKRQTIGLITLSNR